VEPGEGRGSLAAASVPRESPQSPQKLASGGLSDPHFGQRRDNALPHRMQNFLPAAFSKLQLEQRIDLSIAPKELIRSLYHAGDSKGIASQGGGEWLIGVESR
jgi:hypothetical protein